MLSFYLNWVSFNFHEETKVSHSFYGTCFHYFDVICVFLYAR